MTEDNKDRMKAFLIMALITIIAVVLVATGAACLNYASITGYRTYAVFGISYFAILVFLFTATLDYYLKHRG